MYRSLLLCLPSIALACASQTPSADDSDTSTGTSTDGGTGTDGDTGTTTDTDSDTSTDTSTGGETDTGTDTDDPPPTPLPELVGDNCEVEVMWSYLADGEFGPDKLAALDRAGPNAFVLGGMDEDNGQYMAMLMSVVDGASAWTQTHGPMFSSMNAKLVVDVSVADDGTIVALAGGNYGRMLVYSSAGEKLDQTLQLNSQWQAMVRLPGELRVVGQVITGVDDIQTTLARFDQLGVLLDTVYAPTIGIAQPDWNWATELFVDGERTWVSGWDDDRCGVLIEYNAAGEEQWWTCAVLGEDGEGRVEAMDSLSDGNLVMVGSARITKGGYWYHEPVIAASTRDGEKLWEWRSGPLSVLSGKLVDVAVFPDGGFVTVLGEKNFEDGGLDARELPVILRRDNDGEFVGRCTLNRPGVDPEWAGELTQVVLGEGGEVFVLLAEHLDALWDRNFSIVQITGI